MFTTTEGASDGISPERTAQLPPLVSGGSALDVALMEAAAVAVKHAEQSIVQLLDQAQPGRFDPAQVRIIRVTTSKISADFPSGVASSAGITSSAETPGDPKIGRVIDVLTARIAPEVSQAMDRANARFREQLQHQGLSQSIIETLDEWLEVKAEAHALRRDLERARIDISQPASTAAVDAALPALVSDPMAPLSANELGEQLGIGDEAVRHRERAGELFSVLRVGRKRGREYPAFQGWRELSEPASSPGGTPLQCVLHELGAPQVAGPAVYGFFAARNDLLGELTPVEALVGRLTKPRELEAEVDELLRSSSERRLSAVLSAARAYTADLGA